MADRYFVGSPILGSRAVVTGPEAHHLIHVMRAKPGDQVTLLDDSGAEFPARMLCSGRSEVELEIVSRDEIDRELPFELVVAVSLPKGDRQKWLVEKAVELGVARLVPLVTARSVAQPAERALDRLRRGVIEASKQCGRNRLMKIAEPAAWEAFVGKTAGAAWRLLAHPLTPDPSPARGEGRPESPAKREPLMPTKREPLMIQGPLPDTVYVAVGPEGGFTDDEVALAVSNGWRVVDLGPRILRVETAAIFLAAMVAVRARDQ